MPLSVIPPPTNSTTTATHANYGVPFYLCDVETVEDLGGGCARAGIWAGVSLSCPRVGSNARTPHSESELHNPLV